MKFHDLNQIYLYGGDLPLNRREITGIPWVGLSLDNENHYTIKHNLKYQIPLPDNSVSIFQLEDVLEHIEIETIPAILNEAYRVLRPSGLLRISVPNYECKLLIDRTDKDPKTGQLLFDKGGGGNYINGKVVNGGHLWFPTYKIMKEIIDKSKFMNYQFLHYIENGKSILNKIDYSMGYIARTPDHDSRTNEALSIVIDLYKS